MVSLPSDRTPLYHHTLPALEAWLRGIGAIQDPAQPELWRLSGSGWHAGIRLEVEEIAVRWQGEESGERLRRFPYGLCRADVEAAILAGP